MVRPVSAACAAMIRSWRPRGSTRVHGRAAAHSEPLSPACNQGRRRRSHRRERPARTAARSAVSAISIPTRYSATEPMRWQFIVVQRRAVDGSAFVGDQDVTSRIRRRHTDRAPPVKQGDGLRCPVRIHRLAAARRRARRAGRRRCGDGPGRSPPPDDCRGRWSSSPRSTASSRSEKCRDASVAVMVFMTHLSDNQIHCDAPPCVPAGAGCRSGSAPRGLPRFLVSLCESR